MHILQPGEGTPQTGLIHVVLKSNSDPGIGQDLAEVIGELWLSKKKKKIISLFFSAGDGKSILENFSSLSTPMNSKRDRRGCDGQASVTRVPCFPF